jgi:CBS domain
MESTHADVLVERMFSGFGHVAEPPPAALRSRPEARYRALPQSKARRGATYRLQTQTAPLHVEADSPATDVMTDLSRVPAVTIPSGATIGEAHRMMIAHRVRALFVVDEGTAVLGIITSSDISGEGPMQLAQQQGVRRDEVPVRDAMTPAELLEAVELEDVLEARVGDIVESLKHAGRQHVLVIESAPASAAAPTHTIRGVFSLTQIARQLGLPPQPVHNIARTFAEIEAAIGA